LAGHAEIRDDRGVYEVTEDVVSGHALAARWKVRTYLLREVTRPLFPAMGGKEQRERYHLGRDEQAALKDVFFAIDRVRDRDGRER
jgi:hypothetical protein